MPLRLIRAVTLGALLTVCHLALAKNYHVEAIIFQNPVAGDGDEEVWSFSPYRLTPRFRHMAELAARSSEHEFSPQLEKLAPLQEKLDGSGHRILQTVSWEQSSSSYRDAPLIPLANENTDLASGFLRIYTTSLIYADLDLLMSPRVLPAIGSIGSLDSLNPGTDTRFYPPHYFISEKRRLKFGELHYFDHPKFGAVIGVWPKAADTVATE